MEIMEQKKYEVAINTKEKLVYLCMPNVTVKQAITNGSNIIRIDVLNNDIMVHHMGCDMVTIINKDDKNYNKLIKFAKRINERNK